MAPRHWPLCGEFTGTGEFPAQRASYVGNVSIWWRHHGHLTTGGYHIYHLCHLGEMRRAFDCLMSLHNQGFISGLEWQETTSDDFKRILAIRAPPNSGIIMDTCSANGRRRYIVTSSLVGRAHTQNNPRHLLKTYGKVVYWKQGVSPELYIYRSKKTCYICAMIWN